MLNPLAAPRVEMPESIKPYNSERAAPVALMLFVSFSSMFWKICQVYSLAPLWLDLYLALIFISLH